MAGIARLFHSSIGRKFSMALTGLLLFGFLIGHLSGNLLIFKGQGPLNDYAAWLASLGPVLWVVRLVLLAIFATHVVLGISLAKENRAARPERYAYESTVKATLPSRWMVRTGLLVLAYVLYHLAHFTFGIVQPAGHAMVDATGRPDVYGMVVHGFRNPVVTLSYVAFLAVLGFHLWHGLASFFQTMGLSHQRYSRCVRALAHLATWILILGYVAIPMAVLTGLVGKS
ncbi:MAG: succinate dehydrogenase cytochrome b subunit [Planctomycetes bacterium]|nr:succinate dehydrogenase cytochrome b subunit [Planctomycetota bacterium]